MTKRPYCLCMFVCVGSRINEDHLYNKYNNVMNSVNTSQD